MGIIKHLCKLCFKDRFIYYGICRNWLHVKIESLLNNMMWDFFSIPATFNLGIWNGCYYLFLLIYKGCKEKAVKNLIEPELHLELGPKKMCKYPTVKQERKSGNHPVGQLTANIFHNLAFSD